MKRKFNREFGAIYDKNGACTWVVKGSRTWDCFADRYGIDEDGAIRVRRRKKGSADEAVTQEEREAEGSKTAHKRKKSDKG